MLELQLPSEEQLFNEMLFKEETLDKLGKIVMSQTETILKVQEEAANAPGVLERTDNIYEEL